AEVAQAEIDVQLARVGVLRAGLERVSLSLHAAFSEGYQVLNLNAPAALCPQIGGCPLAGEARLVNLTANLVVPLWSGFTIEADFARARRLERVARAQQRSLVRQLALDVATVYWSVRRAELLLEVARHAVTRDEIIVS